eukprot:CAMPEP_0171313586 /NCGR_PEP_ID=MMETSP0816-20121228/44047_1 /TAXON_ID=420281 /ORGANISM="Proboscia inermis, Strain CCAP1064/1" /LENGTH=73 /DNA_ID=CAMNT_0011801223 /DNA_START=217 /DNA_END=438 /DNA_ORIENTATION=+
MGNDGVTGWGSAEEPNPHRRIASHDVERWRGDGVGNQIPIVGTHPMMGNYSVTARGRAGDPNRTKSPSWDRIP